VDPDRLIQFATPELRNSERLQILRMVHDTHRQEMNFHRETMNKLVQWATGVYLAIAGGLLVLGANNWRSYGTTGKFLAVCILFLVTSFVVRQILHSASAINTNARIVVRADKLMHLFDKDFYDSKEQLYPAHWLKWGDGKGAGYYEWFNIGIIILLAFSIGAFAWIL
jgi:hypothetical protein